MTSVEYPLHIVILGTLHVPTINFLFKFISNKNIYIIKYKFWICILFYFLKQYTYVIGAITYICVGIFFFIYF